MKTIAVTATGGGVGQSIIKALRGSQYRLLALDSEPTAAGLYMADGNALIPYASADDYIARLNEILIDEKVDLLFPGMDCELQKLSQQKDIIKECTGTTVVISDPGLIELADDKYLTNQLLKINGLPSIATIKPTDDIPDYYFKFPIVIKPQCGGARSKDVRIIKEEDEFAAFGRDLSGMIIQEYIEGPEYTCGTLTLNGKFYGCIVMRRILRDGDTHKAFVERDFKIEKLCEVICNLIKPEGAFNIQLRMKDGIPYVFEFNARCSGTTAARALAGFNEPLMIADYYLEGKPPEFNIKETNILRYWNEIVVDKLI